MINSSAPYIGEQLAFWLDGDPNSASFADEANTFDNPQSSGWEELNVNRVIDRIHAEEWDRIFIENDAGMGKSTTVERLAYEFAWYNRDHLVVLLPFGQLVDTPIKQEGIPNFLLTVTQWLRKQLSRLVPASYEQLRNLFQEQNLSFEQFVVSKFEQKQIIFLIDSLDQAAFRPNPLADPLIQSLATFLTHQKAVFAGRHFHVAHYFEALQQENCKRIRLGYFNDRNQKKYLTANCYQRVRQVVKEIMGIPRALQVIRKLYFLSPAEFDKLHSSADLYVAIMQSLISIGLRGREIKPKQAVYLFSLVAFEMIRSEQESNGEFMYGVDDSRFERFVHTVWNHHKSDDEFIAIVGKASDQSAQPLLESLVLLLRTNEGWSEGILDQSGVRQIQWRDDTLRDFFAALFLSRFSNDCSTEWLNSNVPGAEASSRRGGLYWTWRFLAEIGQKGQPWIRPNAFANVEVKSLLIRKFIENRSNKAHCPSSELVYKAICELENFVKSPPQNQPKAVNNARQTLKQFQSEFASLIAKSDPIAALVLSRFKKPNNCQYEIRSVVITNAEFQLFLPNHGFPQLEANFPAVNVNWFDAALFCKWISNHWMQDNNTDSTYECRLCSRNEWTVCCLAGSKTKFARIRTPQGRARDLDEHTITTFANIGIGGGELRDVDSEIFTNDWGLQDMQGNCWVWCSDREREQPWKRVLCGGSFTSDDPVPCDQTDSMDPLQTSVDVGFRPVCVRYPAVE